MSKFEKQKANWLSFSLPRNFKPTPESLLTASRDTCCPSAIASHRSIPPLLRARAAGQGELALAGPRQRVSPPPPQKLAPPYTTASRRDRRGTAGLSTRPPKDCRVVGSFLRDLNQRHRSGTGGLLTKCFATPQGAHLTRPTHRTRFNSERYTDIRPF